MEKLFLGPLPWAHTPVEGESRLDDGFSLVREH
jgi:hypothetical protein